MNITFTPKGWEDFSYWLQTDIEVASKVVSLIKEITRDPFKGVGKPEPLRGNLAGFWSRRITGEHRIVYTVSGKSPNQMVTIVQVRFHYS